MQLTGSTGKNSAEATGKIGGNGWKIGETLMHTHYSDQFVDTIFPYDTSKIADCDNRLEHETRTPETSQCCH